LFPYSGRFAASVLQSDYGEPNLFRVAAQSDPNCHNSEKACNAQNTDIKVCGVFLDIPRTESQQKETETKNVSILAGIYMPHERNARKLSGMGTSMSNKIVKKQHENIGMGMTTRRYYITCAILLGWPGEAGTG
jgi:hypothetical protein